MSMLTRINVWVLVRHQFCPFQVGQGRRFNMRHLTLFLIVPIVIGAAALWIVGPMRSTGAVGTAIAVFAIVAAVMTSLMTVIHSIVGMVDTEGLAGGGKWLRREHLKQRLEVLRELYANISFVVLILVLSIVPMLFLLAPLHEYAAWVISGIVYAVSAVVGMSFLNIIVGVYLVLDDQAGEVEQTVEDASKNGSNISKST